MKLGRRHDAPSRRTPPQNRIPFFIPGKDAEAIGEQQSLEAQVAAYRQEPVGVCSSWVGKEQVVGELVDCHYTR